MLKKFFILIFIFFYCVSLNGGESNFWKKYDKIRINNKVAILNVKYVESKASYNNFLSPKIINLAKKCYQSNLNFLKTIEKKFNVDGDVVIGILTVESLCGTYKEKYNVVSVYKTLIELNKNKKYRDKIWIQVKNKYPETTRKWFEKRIKWKSKWAKKQLKSLYKIYLKHKVDVFNLKGSWAGAFGLPQFIPSTFLYYAVDGNNDGKIDLTKFPDSIASVANYLKKHGWKRGIDYKKKFKIVLAYNHSKLYAETVLKIADKLIKK